MSLRLRDLRRLVLSRPVYNEKRRLDTIDQVGEDRQGDVVDP